MGILEKLIKQEEYTTIRDKAVESLYWSIKDYSDWYEECGIYLPPDYAIDPAGWTEVLHKIKNAFRLLYEEFREEGELWEAKNGWKDYGEQDVDRIEELNKEIEEGLSLFGKYLFYFTDPKKGNTQEQ